MYNKIKAATPDVVESKVLDILKESQREVTDLNRSQLFNSEDSNQEPLGTYASIAYANKKGRADVDLKLTGDFYESIFINTSKFPVVFNATDSKTQKLVYRYGEDIFGLTRPSKNEASHTIIKPKLQEWFRNLLHV